MVGPRTDRGGAVHGDHGHVDHRGLPDIQKALGFFQSGLSRVFNAYVVAFGGLLLLGGRLSGLLGPRRVFIAGCAVLTAGSLAAGLASAPEVAIAGRALQVPAPR